MKVGIVIPTYYKNEIVFEQLRNTLKSVYNQTYKDYVIYLIGDKFEPSSKWNEIIKEFTSDKLKEINLEYAIERNMYKGHKLWWTGGVNAVNTGLEMCLRDEVDICARLDHDDIWAPNHLELIVKAYNDFPESVFIYTSAKRFNEDFPGLDYPIEYNNLLPRPGGLVHSTVTWKVKELPLKYTDTVAEGINGPADAYLWKQTAQYLKENNLKSLYLPKTTVLFTKKKKDNGKRNL